MKRRWLVSLLLPFLIGTSKYVDNVAGTDSAACGALGSPCKTIMYAGASARTGPIAAGQEIIVRGTAYTLAGVETISGATHADGTVSAPIVIRPMAGETVVIDLDGPTHGSDPFRFDNGADYWDVRDISFINGKTAEAMIGVSGFGASTRPTNIRFINCTLHNDSSGLGNGIALYSCDDCIIDGCTGYNLANGFVLAETCLRAVVRNSTARLIVSDGFVSNIDTQNWLFDRCMAYDCGDTGYDLSGTGTVKYCTAHDIPGTKTHVNWDPRGFKLWPGRTAAIGDITAHHLLVHSCASPNVQAKENQAGIHCEIRAEVPDGTCNVYLDHATTNYTKIGLYAAQASAGSVLNVCYRNCIFSNQYSQQGNSDVAIVVDNSATVTIDAASDYNLFFPGLDALRFGIYKGTNIADLAAWLTAAGSTIDDHSIESNPRYKLVSFDDYHLASGSPALGSGLRLSGITAASGRASIGFYDEVAGNPFKPFQAFRSFRPFGR